MGSPLPERWIRPVGRDSPGQGKVRHSRGLSQRPAGGGGGELVPGPLLLLHRPLSKSLLRVELERGKGAPGTGRDYWLAPNQPVAESPPVGVLLRNSPGHQVQP